MNLRLIHALRFLLAPIAAAGARLGELLNRADEADRIRRALKPGTRLKVNCNCCPPGTVWYVVKYNADADDYKISQQWPHPDGFVSVSSGLWKFQKLNQLVTVVS